MRLTSIFTGLSVLVAAVVLVGSHRRASGVEAAPTRRAVIGATVGHAAPAVRSGKWEYKVVHHAQIFDRNPRFQEAVKHFKSEDDGLRFFQDELNRLGDAGWELAVSQEDNLIFKRPGQRD